MRGDWDSGEGMTGKTIGVRDLGCLALKKLGGGSNNYSSSLSAYSSILNQSKKEQKRHARTHRHRCLCFL